jgi:hypothetical protein
MNIVHNFNRGAALSRSQSPLTIEQLRQRVPSAFATGKHESRSERYTYIPTSAVIEGLMKAGFFPFSAKQSHSRIPGKTEFTKHMIRFRHADRMESLVVGDSVPEVVLVNAHDGTSAYQLSEGLFRLVCSNGLMVPESIIESLKIPHKGDVVDRVIEGSFEIIQQSEKVLGKVEQFQAVTLSAPEQRLLAEQAHYYRFADAEGVVDTPITPDQLLEARRYDDLGPDLWKTFNRIQENVIKGGLSGTRVTNTVSGRQNRRRVTTREVKGIDQDMRLNRALFTLAERMAELKSA